MKAKNKLNNILIEALRNKPEPLHDAQWDKLYAELHKEKKKRLFWLFFLYGFIGILASVAILLKPFSTENKAGAISSPSAVNSGKILTDAYLQANSQLKNIMSVDSVISLDSLELNTASNINQTNSIQTNKTQTTTKRHYNRNYNSLHFSAIENLKQETYISSVKSDVKPEIERPANELNPQAIFNPNQVYKDVIGEKQATEQLDSHEARRAIDQLSVIETDSTDFENLNIKQSKLSDQEKDSSKKTSKAKENNSESNGKFIFGLSFGLNLVNTKITQLTGETFMHKDTRSVFEATNSRQSSTLANLSFEYKLRHFGLRINSGLQYRNIYNQVDFTYKLKEIAMRNSDNSISFYIPVPDSSALEFALNNTQIMRFLTVPVLLSYGIPIKDKYELFIHAGANVTALVGAKGQGFDINNTELRPIGSFIQRKVSFGFTGGLQISRHLYDRWWLGLESNLSQIRLGYKMGDGAIQTKIFNTSLNLQLRYKL